MEEDPKKHKEGMIRDFLSRWGRVAGNENGQAPEGHGAKTGEPEEEEISACSVCAAEVPPNATVCPHCGTRFLGAPEELPEITGAEAAPATDGIPSPPPEIKGAPPSVEVPPPEPEQPQGLKRIILPPALKEAPSVTGAVESRQMGTRHCNVCRASMSPAAEVCLVCGTSVSDRGVRKLARPFEPETDLESDMPGPREMTGEELEITKDDTDWQAWLVQGDIYYNAGRVEKAIEAYDTSLRIRASFEAYNNKGLVLFREGLLEEALKCLDRALEFQDNDEFIWFNKGNALRDLGRFNECIAAYDRAITIKPDFDRAWAATGHALLAEGRNDDAVVCFESALRINWDNEQTWHAIGSALSRAGRSEEAETALKKAVEIRKDFWEAWYDLAEIQIELGKVKDALVSLRNVTEHNPRHWRAWLECGGLLGDMGREKEALAYYARAAQLNPGNWQTWRALGHEYFSLKRYGEASRCFGRATKINDSDASLLLEAAESHYLVGRPQDALEAAEKALLLKQSPEGWLSRGISSATLGSLNEAITSFDKGLALDPGSPRLWFEKAQAQGHLGQTKGALESYDRALVVNPIFEKALSAKGRLLMEMGRGREALDCLDKAVSIRPTLDKLENIAHLRQMIILSEAVQIDQKPPAPEPVRTPLEAIPVSEAAAVPATPRMAPVMPEVAPEMVPEGELVILEPPDSLGAWAVPESEPEAPPAADEAPPEFEMVDEPSLVTRAKEKAAAGLSAHQGLSHGRGLVNGRAQVMGRGLTNGRGITNGRGLTNGKGAVNGTGLVAGHGMVNGKGLVNGRSKGEGLVNGRGMINGRSLINGNGVVNGPGVTDGIHGGEGGAYGAYVRRAKRRSGARTAAIVALAVAAVLIIPYMAFQMAGPRGIQIDGDFADWEGMAVYADSYEDQLSAPSVNLVNFSTSREAGFTYFMVQTAGRILQGAADGVDDIRIFIDSDASSATGYRISGMGADRMLELYGFDNRVQGSEVYSFNASRSREDWNGWYLVGSARAAARGASVEVGAARSDLGIGDRGRYLASVRIDDGKGNTDTSDFIIGNERGALVVVQSGLAPPEISNLSAPATLLAVNLSAFLGDLTVTGLRLVPLGATGDRPSAIANISLYLDTGRDMVPGVNDILLCSTSLIEGAFNISFPAPLEVRQGITTALLVTGSLRADAPAGAPVGANIPSRESVWLSKGAGTLTGSGGLGFVISQLPRIIIDGSFGDWDAVSLVNDTNDSVSPDVDILHHAVASDREALSFYLDVEGEMLGGTLVPAAARARPAKPGPIGPPTPVAPLPLPVVTGEDTAAVFIDADRNCSTGIMVAGMLGADFSVQVTGKEGRVLSSAAYRAGPDGNWSLVGAAPAATDARRLEAQVTFVLLGIPACAVDALIYTTDWNGQRDYSSEAKGRGGELNITARSIAPAVATPGISWPMLAMTITATGGPVLLYSVEITQRGDVLPQEAPRAFMFTDADASGDFSSGDVLLPGSQGNWSAGAYRCSPAENLLVPEGGTRLLFVIVELAASARDGSTIGVEVTGAASIGSSALEARGSFPMSSGIVTVVRSGGRSSAEAAATDRDWVRVAMMTPAGSKLSGIYGQDGDSDGRAPTGGWPTNWTRIANDSNNAGPPYVEIDIINMSMTDNSNYIYFKLSLENLSSLDVNDEWNIYFKTNDDSNNNRDRWYRLTLRVTNATAPTFTSTLYSYIGNNNPPDRGDFSSVNETHAGTGNSTDGTMYGYLFDKANNSILFYGVKSQLYGNLLAPGQTTRVYADTWYVNNNNRWRNYDRSPNGGGTGSYTMIPEFQDIIAPLAGMLIVYIFLSRTSGRPGRRGSRARSRSSINTVTVDRSKRVMT